jgi:Uma2 family endonuclease
MVMSGPCGPGPRGAALTQPAPLPGPYRITYADWLRFPDDGKLWEIIEGEVFVSPPPTTRHQRVSARLYRLLVAHVEDGGLGEVLFAPVGVRLSDEDVLEPDIVVLLAEHVGRIEEQAIVGPPDMVVEILSAGTARRDLSKKRATYESAGVQEYWIVDPESVSIDLLVLDSGSYRRSGLFRKGDVLRSPLLPGLEIRIDGVFPPGR